MNQKRSLQQYAKTPKQKHAGDSNIKNGKVLTHVPYPQGIIKNSLQRFCGFVKGNGLTKTNGA